MEIIKRLGLLNVFQLGLFHYITDNDSLNCRNTFLFSEKKKKNNNNNNCRNTFLFSEKKNNNNKNKKYIVLLLKNATAILAV